MIHYRAITSKMVAAMGFTDLFVIQPLTDFAATTTVATDLTITLDALAFGDLVKQDVLLEIDQILTGIPSADTALTAAVGVTGATTQFIGAGTIMTGGAAVAAKTGFVGGTSAVNYDTPTGGKSLLLTLDITDADGALSSITGGELRIWCNISRWADRHQVQT